MPIGQTRRDWKTFVFGDSDQVSSNVNCCQCFLGERNVGSMVSPGINWETRVRIGRFVLFALRHDPFGCRLVMDKNGWVDIACLVDAVCFRFNWGLETERANIQHFVKEFGFDSRLQFSDTRVRAAYGHSTQCFQPAPVVPPDDIRLFHGSDKMFEIGIFTDGLRPMNRRYVQLTTQFWYAYGVGNGINRSPIVFEIDTDKALKQSVRFYTTGGHVWFCDAVDSTCLRVALIS